jgi:hypothetical protein
VIWQSGQVVLDPLSVALCVVRGAGIRIFHAIAQCADMAAPLRTLPVGGALHYGTDQEIKGCRQSLIADNLVF